jgi:mRNA interferase MazF
VQGDAFNASRLATVVVVPLTSNLRWASAPGNVLLAATRTGLPRDSVANVSQLVAIDRSLLTERVGHLSGDELELVLAGVDLVLGRA